MRPQVILHNSISLDNRTTGFAPDIGLHYQIASRLNCDAHLAGSDTILAMSDEATLDDAMDLSAPRESAGASNSLLVVPDSRGRVRFWRHLQQQPFWGKVMAICSESTPSEYRTHLDRCGVEYLVAGDERVDFASALTQLAERCHVRRILLDSGGTLNAVLLSADLIDEVSLIISPTLVGDDAETAFLNPLVRMDSTNRSKLANPPFH